MKFAYIAAALLPFAYARSVALDIPTEDSLAPLDARAEDKLAFIDEAVADLEEREEDDLFDFLELEEREEDDAFDALELEEREEDIFDEEDVMTEAEKREALGDLEESDFEDAIDDTIEARSAKGILRSLKSLNAHTVAVKRKLDAFGATQKPSTRQALAVRAAAQKLSGAISKATRAANSSKRLSGSASKKIFNYVKGPLVHTTFNTLSDFQRHKKAFAKGGFTGLVRSNLVKQKGQVGKLGKALLKKAGSKSVKRAGKKVLKRVQKKFSKTIKAY